MPYLNEIKTPRYWESHPKVRLMVLLIVTPRRVGFRIGEVLGGAYQPLPSATEPCPPSCNRQLPLHATISALPDKITSRMAAYTIVVHLKAKEDPECIDKLVAKLQEASQVYSNDKECLSW